MKTSIPVLLCACIAAAASADTLYPVYTVTSATGGGVATNYLESSMVQIVDSEGATPREVAYADIDKSAGSFSGTFVIEADSYLMGSVTMTNFTGEIRIKSGALIVDAVGWLGVADAAQAPKLYVESGATLMPTCPVTRGGKIYNELHLAGEGYNGLGALCCSYRAAHTDHCFYNHIYLEDDATIGMRTTYRVDMYTSADLYLQDHTLTVKDVRKTRTSPLPTFCPYASRFIPGSGHVEVDHVILQVQGQNPKGGWGGTAENTLVLYNDSSLNFYNTQIPVPWTFMVGEGESIVLSDSSGSQERYYRNFPATNCNYYTGPVCLGGTLKITRSYPYTFTCGVCLSGDMSGSGNLDSQNGWLQLAGSNTAYRGTICVGNGDAAYGGLALWREEAVSTHSAGYYLTNAPLKLVAEGRLVGGKKTYDLPPINFHVDSFTNFEVGVNLVESNIVDTVATGGMNARMASLKKTGDGELALVANFDITGRTEIAGGTLRLAPASRYSAFPGLWEGIFETNETATAELVTKYTNKEIGMNDLPMYARYNTEETLSNRVTSSAYLFARKGSPYWHYMMAPTYTGYIWNRESTNITVTFAGAIRDAWKIYLRGSNVANLYDGSKMGTTSRTLYPGANAIMLRGWNRNSNSPGWFKPSNMPDWNLPYMGFAMAYGNTSSDYDASHYFVPMNGMAACAGGDGIMFTRDARRPEEFTAEELSTTRTTIAELAMSGGGILDLSGSPLFIKTLEGAGTVTNGSLTVKENWSLGYSDISSGNALAVDGAMTFADGATIAFDDQNARLNAGVPVPFAIVTAKDGVTGNPSFSCGKKNWRMELSGDGRSLMAVCYPKGISVSFK